jgi:hypothetical protein
VCSVGFRHWARCNVSVNISVAVFRINDFRKAENSFVAGLCQHSHSWFRAYFFIPKSLMYFEMGPLRRGELVSLRSSGSPCKVSEVKP